MAKQSSGKKSSASAAKASSNPKAAGRKRAAGSRRRRGRWTALAYLIIAALVLLIAIMLLGDHSLIGAINPARATPTPAPTPTPAAVVTPAPTPTPMPTPTPTPAPTPTPKGFGELDAGAVAARTDDADIGLETKVYANGVLTQDYQIGAHVRTGDSAAYTALEGITTFRGNNYRDSAAHGFVPNDSSRLSIAYSFRIGGIDSWSGVGWTGQPVIVRWDGELRRQMNINEDKKAKEDLVEVIYAAMDGKIHFFDLDDGQATRPPISIGAPIKGTVTVDPRGYPLLYCGQGIDEVKGRSVEIGMRVFSLIDQTELLFIDGRDEFATRRWYASDCAPLVDAASDRLLWNSENGLFYSILLNTDYDRAAGTIAIEPVIDRYWYASKVSTRPGMESSLALYNHYAFLADNSGLLQCLDVNTLSPVWAFYAGDDTDASPVLEADEDGNLALYTATELDLNKNAGTISIRRLNALTGAQVWVKQVKVTDSERGGAFATPALGKGSVSNMVYFVIARTADGNMLFALNKETGEEVWTLDIGGYSWSSPTLTYDANGRAYILLGNYNGALRLIDAKSGELLTKIDLEEGNMEGSPAIFGDTLIIGTRSAKIFAVKIS